MGVWHEASLLDLPTQLLLVFAREHLTPPESASSYCSDRA